MSPQCARKRPRGGRHRQTRPTLNPSPLSPPNMRWWAGGACALSPPRASRPRVGWGVGGGEFAPAQHSPRPGAPRSSTRVPPTEPLSPGAPKVSCGDLGGASVCHLLRSSLLCSGAAATSKAASIAGRHLHRAKPMRPQLRSGGRLGKTRSHEDGDVPTPPPCNPPSLWPARSCH